MICKTSHSAISFS